MASQSFIERGGSEPEYEIYKALYSTGRKEPADFVFKPAVSNDLSFLVFTPRVGIKLGQEDATARFLLDSMGLIAPRVEYINPAAAIADGRSALLSAIGG